MDISLRDVLVAGASALFAGLLAIAITVAIEKVRVENKHLTNFHCEFFFLFT